MRPQGPGGLRRAAWRRKTTLLVAVAVLAAGVGVLAYATHLLRRTELQSIDARFSIRGPRPAPRDVVLVQIDDATFQQLTREHLHSEFPFPRRYDAQVIGRLRRGGASTIAMDIEFTHPTDRPDDEALAQALAEAHGKTVLAATEVGPGGTNGVLGESEALRRELGTRAAAAILTTDSDGSVRRFAYQFNGLRSFGVVTAEVARGRAIAGSLFEHGTLPIDYAGPPETFASYSFSKVLKGEVPAGAFRDKIVIVGASAPVLQDVHTTATSGSEEMSGPEIWANATSSLLAGAPLRQAAGWVEVLLILALGLAAPLGSLRLARWHALLGAVCLAALYTVAVQVAFQHGWIVSFVYPLLALAVGTLGTLAVLYMDETIERERVRYVFSRFVPGSVVDQVLASANENLRLGGVECDCTVLFSDLRGFTSFSETQPAARVIEVVNHYLNEMTEAILDAGGTLIAYMGDGIMAVFGAPIEQDDHADRAVRAALEMIGPRLARFNGWLAEQGFGHSFAMGVGLNSGPVMAGNVGSEERVEYTAIGDTTNTASRLEGMTKGSGHMLFIADSTQERLRERPPGLTPVGEFEVRGRTAKLPVWTIAQSKLTMDRDGGPARARAYARGPLETKDNPPAETEGTFPAGATGEGAEGAGGEGATGEGAGEAPTAAT
ncbi:MAG TPA: adenylate/guanylate cyclase domain-containing protein [Solirubrobacteraceae bacterium]|nr:adenylate/guanylate cyclase domain-containing protein [Solirubrobacteraceae bacterium]